MLRDRAGRVALRGAAQARLVALEADARGPDNGGMYAERNAGRVHDEWDRGRPDAQPPPGVAARAC